MTHPPLASNLHTRCIPLHFQEFDFCNLQTMRTVPPLPDLGESDANTPQWDDRPIPGRDNWIARGGGRGGIWWCRASDRLRMSTS
mmetsp:Transcript_10029/g.16133  ORF Transcript_10029/g.16133 Transcript_10029/m.16133 type:complete len:85 (+) Transcript_10029:137-391(+)